MPLTQDYLERVYAGVLGKIIGVYLGRPFEGWTYERIMAELGEIWYYVHEQRNVPLIVTDDDISGTFTFVRALADYGHSRDLTPQQIAQTWLNYIIEGRTILWWGGLGMSTEHTAYIRLKSGVSAPESGSMALNSAVVAEQIGAQIFIDGWGMVAPGDPALAADLARRAGSVSHDGEAIYGAQVVAAMEAQAFVEPDINRLIDCGVSFIPKDSIIYRMIEDIREWHAREEDWRKTREQIAEEYGYHRYGGNCHIVPNHALIIHALLHGEGDFQRSLMIINTSGWDTDCNSGNVGCLLGIKLGLEGIDVGPDWRGPVADRMYLSTADGGRAITDAAAEAYRVTNIGQALAGLDPVTPKQGARFHFEVQGAVQGFQAERSARVCQTVALENALGHSLQGERSLAIRYRHVAPGTPARVATDTFIPPESVDMPGYGLIASPTLYSGQTVRARITADDGNHGAATCRLFVAVYDAKDELTLAYGPEAALGAGAEWDLEWPVPDTDGHPIARIGFEIAAEQSVKGSLYLDYLTWDGSPDVVLGKPESGGNMWRRAWVNGVDHFEPWWQVPYNLAQDYGTGLLIQGTREWGDYLVSAPVRPHLVTSVGIGARVQGMRRYYALLLGNGNKIRLVKALDGTRVLAEADFPWQMDVTYNLALGVIGNRLEASVDGRRLFRVEDSHQPLLEGGVALMVEEGLMESTRVRVQPAG
jgi:ADP-ribosylglycohydrolase